MHADQLAPLIALAARKGVDLGLSSLYCYGGDDWQWDYGECDAETAALIVTGSLAKWLAGQGIAVVRNTAGFWIKVDTRGNQEVIDGHLDDPHIDALISAATARLEEMNDKEKA